MKIYSLFIAVLVMSIGTSSCVTRKAHADLQNAYKALNEEKTQLTKLTAESQRDLKKLKDEYTALQVYSQDNINELRQRIIALEKELQHAQLQLQYNNTNQSKPIANPSSNDSF